MQIGAQFYTVREHCRTLAEFSESLRKVADMGYRYVQISGTCDYDAHWLDGELKKNGLSCVLTHTKRQKLLDETEKAADDHAIFGCPYIGLGYYKFTEEDARERLEDFLRDFTPVARFFREQGNYFMYHNHAMEFIKLDGKPILAHLAERMPEDLMGFTLDTYWVQSGGGDPSEWLRLLKGRVPAIHLKDYAFGPKMAVLGEGNLNFDRILKSAEDAGTKYLLVEQDDCYGEDPFACLKRSFDYLKARGLE